VTRIFLLSPASASGVRAQIVLNPRANFPLARAVRSEAGAPIGDLFAFLSGLYFRGKLAYGRAFASPASGLFVITPDRGLVPPDLRVTIDDIRAFAAVDISEKDRRYREPLERDSRRVAELLDGKAGGDAGGEAKVVLLGSIATRKYTDVLGPIFGASLHVPAVFPGCGDMRRGSLLLKAVRAGTELDYIPLPSR
jgi:hypothetical protein